MRILRCGEDGLDELAEFFDTVTAYLEANVNYPKWTRGKYPARESSALAIAAGTQYICEDNGRIVGAFVLNSDPQGDYSRGSWRTELREGEYLVIHALAADPSGYRRGIGRCMVDFCVQYARDYGWQAVRADVVPDNAPARRLFESAGFSFAGERDLSRGIKEIPVFALYELNVAGEKVLTATEFDDWRSDGCRRAAQMLGQDEIK